MNEKIKLSVCALVVCHDTLLIVKRSSSDQFLPNVWEFPGGGVEKGETLQQALIRELKEEINLDVSALEKKLIGVSEELSLKNPIKHEIQFNYEIILTEQPLISLSQEHSEYAWTNHCDERFDNFLKDILKQSSRCQNWMK